MDGGVNEFCFGDLRVAISRYHHYKLSGDRKLLKLYLTQPKEIMKIEGSENVVLALLELEQVLAPENQTDESNWKGMEEL